MHSALLFLLIRNTVKCSANRIVTCDSMRAIHVFRLAKAKNMDVRAAGLALCEDRLWDEAAAQF